MKKQPNSRMCFVCGIDTPIGLHLKFYTDDEGRCIARFRPRPEHQGFTEWLSGSGGTGKIPSHYRAFSGSRCIPSAAQPLSAGAGVGRCFCFLYRRPSRLRCP
jgi:hypothetical protein